MNFDYPIIKDPALDQFAAVTRQFCSLLESREQVEVRVLTAQVHLLLSELYTLSLRLPSTDILFDGGDEDEDEDEYELDEETPSEASAGRRLDPDRLSVEAASKLRSSLESIFEDACYYREVFDPWEADDPEVTGSLGDDLTDIYGDLISGLRKWDRGEGGAALWEWRFGFEIHWGEHVTGAIRALHTQASWHDGPWPYPDHIPERIR
jgi:hypothetical protein